MKVLILSTQSADWEAMYIDGKLIEEGHKLGEGDNFFFLLEMAEKYSFKRSDVKEAILNDRDDKKVSSIGNMPSLLSEFNGKY